MRQYERESSQNRFGAQFRRACAQKNLDLRDCACVRWYMRAHVHKYPSSGAYDVNSHVLRMRPEDTCAYATFSSTAHASCAVRCAVHDFEVKMGGTSVERIDIRVKLQPVWFQSARNSTRAKTGLSYHRVALLSHKFVFKKLPMMNKSCPTKIQEKKHSNFTSYTIK